MKKIIIVILLLIISIQVSLADTNGDVEDYIDKIEKGEFSQEDYENYMENRSSDNDDLALAKFLEARLMLNNYMYKEAYEALETSLSYLGDDENLRLKAEVLYYLSEMDMFFSDITSSVARSVELREISNDINYYKGVIEADYNIAYGYIYNYDYSQGTDFASEAFDLSRKHEYKNGLAGYYSFLGHLDYFNGEKDDAIAKYELALASIEAEDHSFIIESGQGYFNRVLAYEYLGMDDGEKASKYIEALKEETEFNSYYVLYMIEEMLGQSLSSDEPEIALKHYNKAYDYYQLASVIENSYPYEVYLLEAIGNMNYDLGNYVEAAEYYYQVIKFEYSNGDDAYGDMVTTLDEIKYDEVNSKISLLEELNMANKESMLLSKKMVWFLTIGIIVLMVAVVFIVIEIRAKSKTEKELYYISITDSLTKVYNRGKIIDVFKENLNKDNAILLMDVDNFKNINDKYGHLVGDEVLITMTDLVKDAVRDCDKIGRYGGEEFLVVLEKTSSEEITDIAERIRSNIADYNWPYSDMVVTVSIGVTTCFSSDAEEVLHEADTLMYQAKNTGKNKIVFGC